MSASSFGSDSARGGLLRPSVLQAAVQISCPTMSSFRFRTLGALALAFAGCASAQSWPDWALSPPSGTDLAAGDCVTASGSMGVDRQQASARARLALAQQIEVRIEAMDQTWESRVREGKAEKLASSFTSASKQIVNLTLQGAKLSRAELVKARGGDLLCVVVTLESRASEKLPGDVIRSAGAKVDEDTETLLVARFKQAAAARAKPQS